nr:hypothetical protein [Pseudomonas sp.]
MALPVGAVVILAPSAALRAGHWGMPAQDLAAIIAKVDMLALGALLLYCNLMVAIAWGALIVMVMKGPAYVADSYPLIDADSPGDTPLPLGELEAWHGWPKAFTYPGPNVAAFVRNWRWRAHGSPGRPERAALVMEAAGKVRSRANRYDSRAWNRTAMKAHRGLCQLRPDDMGGAKGRRAPR